ncbi:MAG: hypothetical protein SFT68_03965, partial [Rickettsiaceae bacterium]|nr:hypothetical protein [Rickettsiaceae bacterium]
MSSTIYKTPQLSDALYDFESLDKDFLAHIKQDNLEAHSAIIELRENNKPLSSNDVIKIAEAADEFLLEYFDIKTLAESFVNQAKISERLYQYKRNLVQRVALKKYLPIDLDLDTIYQEFSYRYNQLYTNLGIIDHISDLDFIYFVENLNITDYNDLESWILKYI